MVAPITQGEKDTVTSNFFIREITILHHIDVTIVTALEIWALDIERAQYRAGSSYYALIERLAITILPEPELV